MQILDFIETNPNSIDLLFKATTPCDKTSLQAFWSLLQFVQKRFEHLSHVCHSLYQLTALNKKMEWVEVHDIPFLAAKDMIFKTILNTRFDPSRTFQGLFFMQVSFAYKINNY